MNSLADDTIHVDEVFEDSSVLDLERLRAQIKTLEQEKGILEQRIAGLHWLVNHK